MPEQKHISILPKEKGVNIFDFITKEEYKQLNDIVWKLYTNNVEINIVYGINEEIKK